MDDMKRRRSTTIRRSRVVPRPSTRTVLSALAALAIFMTACSDVDVDSAMVEVARQKGEREAAAAIAVAEAEVAAQAATEEAEAPDNEGEDASIALNEGDIGTDNNATAVDSSAVASDTTADVDDNEDDDQDDDDEPEGERAEDLDPGDFPGEAATVTQGSWTVADNDLGVRVRDGPAGDILGFVQRPDVVQTTGRGRILNNVAWGEVQFANGDTGWMALDLLEASTGSPAEGFRAGDGSVQTGSVQTASAEDNDDANGTNTQTAGDPTELTTITVQPQGAFISNRSATLSLYTEPDTRSDVVAVGNAGDQLVIINPSGYRNGDIPFVRVSFDGVEGWIDGRYLDVTG